MALTLDNLATFLNLPGNVAPTDPAERAELQRHFDAALKHVRSRCGQAIEGTSTLRVTSASGSTALLLPAINFDSVTAVVAPDGVTVTPTEVDELAGIVRVPVGQRGTWRVTITSTQAQVDLEEATLIIAGHLNETQRRSRPQGGRPGAPAQPAGGSGFAIPHRAADLMAPYALAALA
ncbi:hypothetical protein [Blastococcus sp. TF02A-26]|uniref:hypothetical protein n=1 Tax=Blastococcus sp. TF02A-26 TaxID=2250577 RepID=UPI000DE8E47B|nr:hypothetical protein [Blastococcus sp. TF02A-26]RBY82670.1 hypothetical protein DQ240_18415 [Blastococcus sp. TF02A-26]